MTIDPPRTGRWLAVLLAALTMLTAGCATAPGGATTRQDPWERANRQVFEFNEVLDKVAIKPVALVYQATVPLLVRTGVSNFFGNLNDGWTSVNLFLQAKPRQGLEMGMRTAVNTFFGIGGLMDWAEEMGLEKFTVEDFGQTLGYWGLRSGPFVMLPILGPSTLRDAAGLALDFKDSGPSFVFSAARDRNIASALQLINARVRLLNVSQLLDEIALDKYVLLRDAYLARRKSLIYDGDPPEDEAAPAPYKQLLESATEPLKNLMK